MQRIKFGTDGVRGVANAALTPEIALRLGLAGARLFGGPILVGRDTRLSGGMLSDALAAGAASGGASVLELGVLPTPGVAALAGKLGASAGAVVSASHNPYPDNGIKFFSGEGRKLAADTEAELERLTGEEGPRPTGGDVGAAEPVEEATALYAEHVLGMLRPRAEGMKVLLDCAHGAAYEVAPLAFSGVGADLSVVGNEPDGTNINEGVGSTHVERLDVGGNDVAFAFDGDADRVLAVDETGSVVDGDRILGILARDLQERGVLKGGVVVTVMSNLGFFKAMEGLGIPYEVTPVGDRHVAEAMRGSGASLGGEQSGHVILSEYATTGDGLVTALALLDVMVRSGKPLSELARVMESYPQSLINVPVEGAAPEVAGSGTVKEAVVRAERRLGTEGRILLRPSGTEPVVRVMVEHEDAAVCREVSEEVAAVVAGSASAARGGSYLRFIGCSLAWRPGEAGTRESCLVVLDERGSIVANSFAQGAGELAAAAGRYAEGRRGVVVGVDAPLSVPNERGTRRIERILSKVALPAYSASRKMFGGAPFAEEFLAALEGVGIEYTDYPFKRARGQSVVTEVDSAATLKVLLFERDDDGQEARSDDEDLAAVLRELPEPKFRKGNKEARAAALKSAVDALWNTPGLRLRTGNLSADLGASENVDLSKLDITSGLSHAELDRLADLVEGTLAAYTVHRHWKGRDGSIVVGTGHEGSVLLPAPEGLQYRIAEECRASSVPYV